MNKLENGVIKYQLDFEAYKNGQANEVVALLDNACKELSKFIKKTDGVYTKKRYLEIARKLKDVAATLKENVGNNIDLDGLIEYELKKQKSLLDSVKGDIVKAKGGVVNFLYPTLEQVKTAAMFKPVTDGFTYDSYLDGIEAGLYNIWDSAVRTGYLTGQTTNEIVRNVMGGVSQQTRLANPGLIQTLRNSVYGNTRTVLQSFAAETRNRVFEENEEYFGDGKSEYKYEWLSTLDNRSCLVCGNLGGKLFKAIKDAPTIPLHRGCRCILLPYFNIEGDTRASKDGYVSSKVTFSDWLKEQPDDVQKDVLGATKYKLYKNGESISQFVDNGKVLTIEQLKESIPKSHNEYIDYYNKKLGELKNKSYEGIWKEAVNPSEYESYKDRIPAKKEYFVQKLAGNDLTEGDKAKFTKYLADLSDFEKKGKSYSSYLRKLQERQNKLRESEKILFPQSKVSENPYSAERKNTALWSDSKKYVDSKLRAVSGDVWQSASNAEKGSAYSYTEGSGGFNRPLSGYEKPYYESGTGWEEKYYKGVEKVSIDFEGRGDDIRRLTDLINKSSYDFDVWLQRGSDEAAIEVNLGLKRKTLSAMTEKELQSLVGRQFTNYSFTSTGAAKGQGFSSNNVIWNIYAPKGTKMLYAEPFSCYGNGAKKTWDGKTNQSSFGSEFEVILQRGTAFKITKVERSGGKLYIDMEVHTEKGYKLIQQNPSDWKGSNKNYKS